jgi:hypothetical protein
MGSDWALHRLFRVLSVIQLKIERIEAIGNVMRRSQLVIRRECGIALLPLHQIRAAAFMQRPVTTY